MIDSVREYYRLCSIKRRERRPLALINQIDEKIRTLLFTKQFVELWLQPDGNMYKIKETVIGSGKNNTPRKNRQPVLLF